MLLIKAIISFLKDPDYRELLFTTSTVLFSGTVVFHYVEGWRWLDSLYFCMITLTTVGYGDFTPKTDFGKIFNMGYIIVGLSLILSFIQTVRDHYTNVRQNN